MSKLYLSGIGGSGKARYLFKRIFEDGDTLNQNLRAFLFVKEEELISFYEDLSAFVGKDGNPFPIFIYSSQDAQQRTFTVDKIKNLNKFIVCASGESLNSPVASPSCENGIIFKEGQKYNFASIVANLAAFGYSRVNFTEDRLQFSVRGDIIDVWPAASDLPVRILFEYDTVSALRFFDPGSQLSNTFIEEIKILSVNSQNNTATLKEYFPPLKNDKSFQTLLFFDYPLSTDEEKEYEKYELIINAPLRKEAYYCGYKSLTGLSGAPGGNFRGDIKYFMDSMKNFAREGVKISLYCANDGERERIRDIFYDYDWDYGAPEFLYGNLSQSFFSSRENSAVISSREMLYRKKPVSFPKVRGGRRLEGIWEISAGDYVVHEKYGIGRYVGLKTVSREDKTSEYLCIEYRKGDKLYVPPDEIKTVKKYIGVEGVKPKLYSMDTGAWERVKSRAREAAAEFAKKLLRLYAERSKIKRAPLTEETVWEKELEESFPYEETPDQIKAIEDVKSDFLKPYPMERLICGDVGYGKTEVAVRAAFKIIQDGRQAAILVPTTVLAQQHYNTFYDRLSPFPAKVAVLSRFQTKSRQRKIIKEIEEGKIDIIVGTHRLLQKDVKFKNLGILIIDEEHRFGVKQKEKIKEIKKNIDILMLSATPIPRTLSSALSGFRDLSVIETPPFGRLPIETSLSAYDENMIKTIMEAEISRNGQVFYVYNKVETILTKAAEIKKLLPDVRLEAVHGQMKPADIEKIMWDFTNRKTDILLATTIIESGLDIPSVNTMIIEEAENFGLSQLYQLRGRIGRHKRKAYCYLFYKNENLSDEAVKRLEAMKEFSELGSGFRLAMKDLEIRGAGGILSANQHGFVRDIGYDMFAKLLEEEGKKIKGETFMPQELSKCEVDLNVAALIPQTYIEDDDMRIVFYRRLSDTEKSEEIEKIKNELNDRFGKIPQETQKLFEITALRIAAEKLNIERISEDTKYIYVFFSPQADFSKADISGIINAYSDMMEFISAKTYGFKLKKSKINIPSVDFISDFLVKMRAYMRNA